MERRSTSGWQMLSRLGGFGTYGLRLYAVLFAIYLVLHLAIPAIAQSPPLQQWQRQIEQQRQQATQQRTWLQQQEQSAQQTLTDLKGRIQLTAGQIAQNQQQIQTANQRLKSLEAKLAAAKQRYMEKQSTTVARLRFLQRQRRSDGWAVLLQSQSLNEFLDRRHQLSRVYQRDRRTLSDLKVAANQIKQQHQAIETQKNNIALLTQQQLAQKAESQTAAQYQQDLIMRLRQDREAMEAAETQLAQDSHTLTALIQQRAASDAKVILRGTGVFSFPSDGTITSGFGYRMHPILGYTRFHSGLDFGATSGSPILAADSGIVIFAGWYGGYGQTVVIDHGKNVTTLYGHANGLYVREGETVQRGQPIALVGSSGLSTGPHLHFEVRIGGEPVDPAGYL